MLVRTMYLLLSIQFEIYTSCYSSTQTSLYPAEMLIYLL